MKSNTSTISALTSKCQTTVPKEVREHLRIGPGDRVKWFINPDGTAVVLSRVPITALRGVLTARKHVSIEQMDRGSAQAATQRDQRRMRNRG